MVMLAIIFSHHQLIKAMTIGVHQAGKGTIRRNDVLSGKAFTNLKSTFQELGFATASNETMFEFDFRTILQDQILGNLALPLFRAKLLDAGWAGKNNIIEESLHVRFHDALGFSDTQFRKWSSQKPANLDEVPDERDPNEAEVKTFKFKAGHKVRRSGDVVKRGHGETATARLIHNELQNKLYNYLLTLHDPKNVGTEQTSGPPRTSIDIVVKIGTDLMFYEIKTSASLRKGLREAIPQLLEYAFWPKATRAKELIVVTMNKPTKDAKQYLAHLRSKFSIPIYHETIHRSSGGLSHRI